MAEGGRSKLFHAIVVAGAALGAACSSVSSGGDAGRDAAADTSRDVRQRDDGGIVIDVSPWDGTAAEATCFCATEVGVSCVICDCECFHPADGGSACFPCYI
jgi:hypothetical protein